MRPAVRYARAGELSIAYQVLDGAVFWPLDSDPLFRLVGVFPFPSSDHRLVWVDLKVPGATATASR